MPFGKKLQCVSFEDHAVTLKGHILSLEKAILTLQDAIFTFTVYGQFGYAYMYSQVEFINVYNQYTMMACQLRVVLSMI